MACICSVLEGCGKCVYIYMCMGKTSLSSPRDRIYGVEGTRISGVTIHMLRGLTIGKVHLEFLVLSLRNTDGKMSGRDTPKKDQDHPQFFQWTTAVLKLFPK